MAIISFLCLQLKVYCVGLVASGGEVSDCNQSNTPRLTLTSHPALKHKQHERPDSVCPSWAIIDTWWCIMANIMKEEDQRQNLVHFYESCSLAHEAKKYLISGV